MKKMILVLFCCFISSLLTSNLFAEQTFTFKAPDYEIKKTGGGFDRVFLEGYYSYAVPGYPDLPSKIFRFAVPPNVAKDSIKVEYSIEKTQELGKYEIKELPAMATRHGDQTLFGKKADIYSINAFYPEEVIEYLGFSQMRKWRFVTIKYTPFQYNPVTKDLMYIPEAVVQITYDRMGMNSLPDTELSDDIMDQRAKGLLENYDEAEEWYKPSKIEPRSSATADYVIITTNAIESASTKLTHFLDYLSGKGFSPLVITEDEYGGLTGQSPNGTAEKIRQWLISHFSSHGIQYVLLIGNPDPDDPSSGSDSVGDVPMKMCWPRRTETSDKNSPTDYFYADLTGNWDLDGDQYFGEYTDDQGTGGVDFANEVYVGRIPVYTGGNANLDSVLTKTMNYGNANNIAWRQSALLPMSYSDASTDGAYLSEAMIGNYLSGAGFSNWRLYMQGSLCTTANSSFSSDQELLTDVSWQRWRNYDYGMVWWWGHGGSTSAMLGYSDCGWGDIIDSSDTPVLDNNHPSHVYQCSCNNGYPEVGSATPSSCNLGTALLYNGAITTISASRVSWYAVTSWYTGLKYYCDNASIGYYYGQELVSTDKKASVALYDVKADMGANQYTWWGGSHWMNLFDFNLYGDPAISISEQSVQVEPSPDIKANGLDGPVERTLGDALSVTIELDPGIYTGYPADWWVLANTPVGFYYKNLFSGWESGLSVTHQGPLFNLTPPLEVLNTSGLPTGNYTFYFGVDGNRNGNLDGALFFDRVEVNITPP